MLYCGRLDVGRRPSLEATTVIVHSGGACVYGPGGQPLGGPIALIPSGTPHEVRDGRRLSLVLCIEPRSHAGRRVSRAAMPAAPRSEDPVLLVLGSLRPSSWAHAEEAVRRIIAGVAPSFDGESIGWWRHAALDDALLAEELRDTRGQPVEGGAAPPAASLLLRSELAGILASEFGMTVDDYSRWLRASRLAASGISTTALARGAGNGRSGHLGDAEELVRMFGPHIAKSISGARAVA
jgi:hypothetical protein